MVKTRPHHLSFIDTHVHIIEKYYQTGDWDEISSKTHDDLTAIINVACDLDQAQECLSDYRQIEQRLSMPVFVSVGIHPHHSNGPWSDMERLSELVHHSIKSDPIVAIGECGLDYHHSPYDDRSQKKYFIRQIELSQEMNLPLIMHCRDAWEDFLEIILYHQAHGVIHSFVAGNDILDTLVSSSDIFIGVGGIVTFTKDQDQLDAFSKIPISRLLLETDSPYLSPAPFRGKKNNPYHITSIASFLADLMGYSIEDLSEHTLANTCNLFNLLYSKDQLVRGL